MSTKPDMMNQLIGGIGDEAKQFLEGIMNAQL